MLAPLCLTTLLTAQLVTAPSLVRVLPNGSSVYVERLPGSNRCVVQLWMSARGTEDRAATHGFRHLLEHLMARQVDEELESRGAFLTAETRRSSMMFQIEVAPADLGIALEGAFRLLRPFNVSSAKIEREVRILRHEQALLPPNRLWSRALHEDVFGRAALDPFGNLDVTRTATPEQIQSLHRRQSASSNLSIAVVGEVDPQAVSQAVIERLQTLAPTPPALSAPAEEGRIPASPLGLVGWGLAQKVEGLEERETLASLAVALVAARIIEGTEVTYTVSTEPGLVVLSSSNSDFYERFEQIPAGRLAGGIELLQRWLLGHRRSPERLATFRGALLVEGSRTTLDRFVEGAASLTVEEIVAAHRSFLRGPRREGLR